MMYYENDKFTVPEEYRKMSVSELRSEKEKLYARLKNEQPKHGKKVSRKTNIVFKF